MKFEKREMNCTKIGDISQVQNNFKTLNLSYNLIQETSEPIFPCYQVVGEFDTALGKYFTH